MTRVRDEESDEDDEAKGKGQGPDGGGGEKDRIEAGRAFHLCPDCSAWR